VTAGTIPAAGRVLGVDLGSVRIGVAVCDSARRVATPLTVVVRGSDAGAHRRALADLVVEHEAVGVVVGLPRSLSGQLGPAARNAQAETDELRTVLGVAVETVDERLSTVSASAALRAAGHRAREQRRMIDASAAAVLLQAWIDTRAVPGE
jgi:putative Holliday junction resolvase